MISHFFVNRNIKIEGIFMSTLTAQVHDMVLNRRSSKGLSALVGKDLNLLLNELNPQNERNKAGLDLLIPSMKASGDLTPLHWIAAQFNCVVLELPSANDDLRQAYKEALHASGKFGEVMRSFEHALEDKEVEPWEVQRFIEVAQGGITAMVGFIEVAKDSLKAEMGRKK
ncbi:MAG: hypothetical protein CL942_14195 [Desulfovibrio sp.]|nr:hypothetical protein [Desulfovibrio sp.]